MSCCPFWCCWTLLASPTGSPGSLAVARQSPGGKPAHCTPTDGHSSAKCGPSVARSPRFSEEARHLELNLKFPIFKYWLPSQMFLNYRAGLTKQTPRQQGPQASGSSLILVPGSLRVGTTLLFYFPLVPQTPTKLTAWSLFINHFF